MSHRTQITLSDGQYARLREESRRSGVGLAELVRRVIDDRYGDTRSEALLDALDETFGSWAGREHDGRSYVEGLRKGTARRLAEL